MKTINEIVSSLEALLSDESDVLQPSATTSLEESEASGGDADQQKIQSRKSPIGEAHQMLHTLLDLVPGNRLDFKDSDAFAIVLRLCNVEPYSGDASCTSAALLLLSQLIDNAQLSATTAVNVLDVAVKSMQAFNDHREVQAAGAAIIFVCAAVHADKCKDVGALEVLSSAASLKHFANLEVGTRHPFRFKLGIVHAAMRRLEKP